MRPRPDITDQHLAEMLQEVENVRRGGVASSEGHAARDCTGEGRGCRPLPALRVKPCANPHALRRRVQAAHLLFAFHALFLRRRGVGMELFGELPVPGFHDALFPRHSCGNLGNRSNHSCISSKNRWISRACFAVAGLPLTVVSVKPFAEVLVKKV
jgi:hypothetical protein